MLSWYITTVVPDHQSQTQHSVLSANTTLTCCLSLPLPPMALVLQSVTHSHLAFITLPLHILSVIYWFQQAFNTPDSATSCKIHLFTHLLTYIMSLDHSMTSYEIPWWFSQCSSRAGLGKIRWYSDSTGERMYVNICRYRTAVFRIPTDTSKMWISDSYKSIFKITIC